MGGKPSWVAKTEYNWSSCSGKGSSALEPTLPTFDEEAGATLNTNTQVKAGTQTHAGLTPMRVDSCTSL